jgi:hypothetical protein
MSQLELIINSSLPMPIDICNIIISYATEYIKQELIDSTIYYKYNTILVLRQDTITIGIVNNIPCKFAHYNTSVILINLITNEIIRIFNTCIEILQMGYSNGLVCFTTDSCTIYTVDRYLTLRASMKIEPDYNRLVYVDNSYIIIKTRGKERLNIYDTNLKLLHTIITHNIVFGIALVNNVLSYNTTSDAWIPIIVK